MYINMKIGKLDIYKVTFPSKIYLTAMKNDFFYKEFLLS